MRGFRKPEQPRDQIVLWSQRLDDALPQESPARLLDYILHMDVFQDLFRRWRKDYVLVEGRPPYHPRYMASLYLYGMMNRIRSSRQLESACHMRIDVMWLMSGQTPDHSTIAKFVGQHAERLQELFREVLRMSVGADVVKLRHVAVDGTKIEAQAGKQSVKTEEAIKRQQECVEREIEALEAEWQANETLEGGLFGSEGTWATPSGNDQQKQIAALEREQQKLQKAAEIIQRRDEEGARGGKRARKNSVTDPESRNMKDKKGGVAPNYNAQIAVDSESGLIVAADVDDSADDSGHLTPMLRQIEENCGALPAEASADSAYNTGHELKTLEEMEVVGFMPDSGTKGREEPGPETSEAMGKVESGEELTEADFEALPRDRRGNIDKSTFVYDAANDSYRCPMGAILGRLRTSPDHQKGGVTLRTSYGGAPECATCPRAAACCPASETGRIVTRDEHEDRRVRMRERMSTEEGREAYGIRGHLVEGVFGQIKDVLGWRRFLRRGRRAVRAEWHLVCAAFNLRRLMRGLKCGNAPKMA